MGMDDRSSTQKTFVLRSGLKKDVRNFMGITYLPIQGTKVQV
jgi:hypothetical protein